jgi:hypothetical protein
MVKWQRHHGLLAAMFIVIDLSAKRHTGFGDFASRSRID